MPDKATDNAFPDGSGTPLELVRASTARVVAQASHVHIDHQALLDLTHALSSAYRSTPIAWDESGWHYQTDAAVAGPLTCQYILVLDTLNFCFWPTPGLEYEHLARGLKRALESDEHAFGAERLMRITPEEVAGWIDFSPISGDAAAAPTAVASGSEGRGGVGVEAFSPSPPTSNSCNNSSSSATVTSSSLLPSSPTLPLLLERTRKLQEVGRVLLRHFQGLASNLVLESHHSAVELVRLMTAYFPSFRDASLYRGELIFFYKRAQIFVGDVWAAYGKQTERSHPYSFKDMEQLTMFADYRVPQILRARGVLNYSPALERKIDTKEELSAGSEEEVEIRAATVQAVEQIMTTWNEGGKEGGREGGRVMSVEVDWLLWQEGEKAKEELPPHHRTLTIFY
ncbi:upf0553 family protein [Nannochloropsis oceanica]